MNQVNKGTRVANLLIDIVVIYIVSIFILVVINALGLIKYNKIVYLVIHFLYYLILESVYGQTLGKIITKTEVVNLRKAKPSILRVLLRTILRFNPFDTISYLYGQEQGTHDILSKTRLVNKKF